jgi:hypothetical protein
MSSALPAGTPVAGFTSSVIPRSDLSLSDLAGRQIAFVFSPVDWRRCAPISDPFVIDRHDSLFLSLLASCRHSWCRRHSRCGRKVTKQRGPHGHVKSSSHAT